MSIDPTFPYDTRTQVDSNTPVTDPTAFTTALPMEQYVAQSAWDQKRAADKAAKVQNCIAAGGITQIDDPNGRILTTLEKALPFDSPFSPPIEIERPVTDPQTTIALGCMLVTSDLPKAVPQIKLTPIPETCPVN